MSFDTAGKAISATFSYMKRVMADILVDAALSAHLIHPDDDVAVAIAPIPAGALVRASGAEVRANAAIARGHKIAVKQVKAGAPASPNTG